MEGAGCRPARQPGDISQVKGRHHLLVGVKQNKHRLSAGNRIVSNLEVSGSVLMQAHIMCLAVAKTDNLLLLLLK